MKKILQHLAILVLCMNFSVRGMTQSNNRIYMTITRAHILKQTPGTNEWVEVELNANEFKLPTDAHITFSRAEKNIYIHSFFNATYKIIQENETDSKNDAFLLSGACKDSKNKISVYLLAIDLNSNAGFLSIQDTEEKPNLQWSFDFKGLQVK